MSPQGIGGLPTNVEALADWLWHLHLSFVKKGSDLIITSSHGSVVLSVLINSATDNPPFYLKSSLIPLHFPFLILVMAFRVN